MISVTNMKRNTVEKEKQETSQDFSDVKSDKPNPEIEKLNEQLAELTARNSEITVCILLELLLRICISLYNL